MTENEWKAFSKFREEFRQQVADWAKWTAALMPMQAAAAAKDTPPYPVETAVVYNRALDDILPSDKIKLIVIGDNPGKDEQRAINNRYLVGQSGKVANGFFRRNAELGIDFRKNVIILNKTPIHTAKTAHLKYVLKNGGAEIAELIAQSQIWMAQKTAELHLALTQTQLWLVGYAELKAKGLFALYRKALRDYYIEENRKDAWERVLVFQHFSMNRFLIDLNKFRSHIPDIPLQTALEQLGAERKHAIFSE